MTNKREVWLIKVLKLQREHLADTHFLSCSSTILVQRINFVHADFVQLTIRYFAEPQTRSILHTFYFTIYMSSRYSDHFGS